MHLNLRKCFLDVPRNTEFSEPVSDQYVEQELLEWRSFKDGLSALEFAEKSKTILSVMVSAFYRTTT